MGFKSIVKMAVEEAVKAEAYQLTKEKVLPKIKEGAHYVKNKIHNKTKTGDGSPSSRGNKLPTER